MLFLHQISFMQKLITFIFILSIALFGQVSAQTTSTSSSGNGKITGKIIDEKNGQPLMNAVIVFQGTSDGTVSDWNGDFELTGVKPGTYTLECKMLSYNTKTLSGVEVKANEATTITVSMSTAQKTLGTVNIITKINKESVNALRVLQKNSASVADGLSAENIKRTPDKSTSDVLKRISGVSIQDNKFAVVRGLNDRYNAAYINGAPLPSSEPDRKAFAFDIFPSNMLDNLVIYKTATPELPGEFAGGVIVVNTKDIPENNFTTCNFSLGYNSITTFKNQKTYLGGRFDWLGIDDGSRDIPKVLPTAAEFPTNDRVQAYYAKHFQVDWNTFDKHYRPNVNFQFAAGRNFKLAKKAAGVIVSASYNSSQNYNTTIRRGYSGNSNVIGDTTPVQMDYDYLDKNYSTQVLAGLLMNGSVKLDKYNFISWKNMASINSDNRVIQRDGATQPADVNPILISSTGRIFTSNRVISSQLNGDHFIVPIKLKINWVASYSDVFRNIPNERRTVYSRNKYMLDPANPNPLDTTYQANMSFSNVGADYSGGMFWYRNHENIRFGKVVVSKAYSNKKFSLEAKLGYSNQVRQRQFDARRLGYSKYGSPGSKLQFVDSLLYLGEENIFTYQNMGQLSKTTAGFKIIDGTRPSDTYTASSELNASFIQFDTKYDWFRLIWGARYESFNQKLDARQSINKDQDIHIDTTIGDLLPSLNGVISINKKQNIRFAYSKTLNRPEYRELAPFAFYDFATQYVVSGLDTLKRAVIQNYDLRYEAYPGKGQIISVSAFYKSFTNPIEQVSLAYTDREITYRNLSNANNYGLELETRFLLSSLSKRDSVPHFTSWAEHLTIFTNLAIIRSQVDLAGLVGAGGVSRPLQGQSPYVLNAGAMYMDPVTDLTATLSLNRVGNRVFVVGNVNEPDIWEKSRTFFDLQLAKSFYKGDLEVKFNIQNIFAQDQIFYQNDFNAIDGSEQVSGLKALTNKLILGDAQNKNGYQSAYDNVIWQTNFGRVFSLAASYKF